ncbi:hypothetical protein G6F57_006745 [Rhizopus arrhizus]|uniref:Uncharacterized protein n=1 Tax=Rhizopus oryzae TaxID=64495 RepID=A0A9P7BSG3_RHIOR|nr:hypothetical protein G6F23_009203 [Rhizopus arrhizus]KAG1406198.1 hypothetical protein G6F58_009877 [Rhizopus delemar]KAG0779155.1 hypothetical protein G6F22_010801 [Rhizopus arrhizus]KAG0789503.1 hypothetical protein G6F21_006473 [Rhizopus arrhizus]KAG0817221.1 hypothetical protein G6F20_002563 [Rhizopus arrhizus]
MSVSTYTFDDSNKAFCNVRMNAVEIRPLPVLNENNNIIPVDREFKKLKYAIHKYIFENIKNERVVAQRNLNIEAFALNLFDMHEELGDGFGRPEKRRMATTYDYSKKVKKVDWFHPGFSLNNLLNDVLPFEAEVFADGEMDS